MKTLKENLKTIATYAEADTVNAEGFAAWTPSDTTLLDQLAMTGTLGNSFYANAKAAQRDFVAAVDAGDLRAAEALLREKNIDVNSLTSYYGKFDKGLWAAVATRSPVMRFVKYLSKFIREGVLTEEMLRAKVNVEALKKAKVFPFRLYTAYRAVARDLERKDRKVLAYLADVMDEYSRSYDWSEFAEAKWVVAPDISGSMCSSIGASSVLTYAAVSAMFAGFFVKGLKDVTVLPWDEKVHRYTVSSEEPVMKHIDAITSMVEGGTYMEAGVKYMLANRIEADYSVFLTDTMEYGTGWLTAWKEYHRRYPKAVAFVLRGDSYMTAPIPENVAADLNVYQVFGWNDSVVDYMKFVLKRRKEAA